MFETMKPIYDKVLVKLIKQEEKTSGGIILSSDTKDDLPRGIVVAVGNGTKTQAGTLMPLAVNVGDVVVMAKYAGTTLDEDYVLMREDDILGIIPS